MKRITLLLSLLILFTSIARCEMPMDYGTQTGNSSPYEQQEGQEESWMAQAESNIEHLCGIISKSVWCATGTAVGTVIIGGAIHILLHLSSIIDADDDWIS